MADHFPAGNYEHAYLVWREFLRVFGFFSNVAEILMLLLVVFALYRLWDVLRLVVEFLSVGLGGEEARATIAPWWSWRRTKVPGPDHPE
jgi:hypothetical protein